MTRVDSLKIYIIVPFLLSFLHNSQVECRFILGERNIESIQSDFYGYPNHTEQLDIIWRFDHSIHLDIDYFQLDGQNGDFLLISDLPLTFEDSFEEFNNSEQFPAFLPESIVTSHGVLLSWNVNTTIEVLSVEGTFIYFHAEFMQQRGSFPFKGFNITVKDLDEMRKPTPKPTTEATATTPAPNTPVYINKFLSCNPPQEFLEKKNDFKIAMAEIATEYCREIESCAEFLTSDFNITDVNIPTDDGIHYCDPLWDIFSSCVEVKFAIVRVEIPGGYLMPTSRLEEMWKMMTSQIKAKGYCPYIPPAPLTELNSWIWMASMLGMILFLLFPLCIYWARNEHLNFHGEPPSSELKADAEDEVAAGNKLFYDRNNPIYSAITKITKESDKAKLLEGIYGRTTSNEFNGRGTSGEDSGLGIDRQPIAYRSNVKTNELFQESDVNFEFDNSAYHDDEDEFDERNEEDELYGRGGLVISQEDRRIGPGQLYRDNFLQIVRDENEGNSDTSI